MSTFKPNLAATYTKPGDVKFPCLVSPKIDGVRCLILNGVAVSRSLKPIPNLYIQSILGSNSLLEGLDGELVVGSPSDPNCMQKTTSGVMSRDGEPDFKFFVFDKVMEGPYLVREAHTYFCVSRLSESLQNVVKDLTHMVVNSEEELFEYYKDFTSSGYEGLMIRGLKTEYKQGRSTIKEGGLIKLKEFKDSEGYVVGFEEKKHNTNDQELDNLGHSKRSTKKAGLVGAGTLGVLLLADTSWPSVVRVGSGFTDKERDEIWNNKDEYLGKLWKYKYFDHGIVDAPRHTVSLGERHKEDL